jgi:hypothetical protein
MAADAFGIGGNTGTHGMPVLPVDIAGRTQTVRSDTTGC